MSYFWGTGSDWKNPPGTAHTDRQTDTTTVAFIYKIETIGNPKFVKHRSYESQSSDPFIFFDIFLIYIPKEIKFNYHYVEDI